MALKYGRRPRARNSAVPHLSALIAGVTLPPLPAAADYTAGMLEHLGVMLNDSLGDCLVEGTQVNALNIERAYRSRYNGPVVRIALTSGKRLAVTANHAVLTPRGFVRAKHIKQGDYLVGTSRTEVFPDVAEPGSERYIYQAPAEASEIFSSVSLAGFSGREVVPVSIDFHGDAKFFNGNVDVVAANGFLRSEVQSSLRKPHTEKKIRPASQLQRRFHGARAALQRAFVGFASSLSDMSISHQGSPLAYAHASVPQTDGLRHCAYGVTRSDYRFVKLAPRYLKLASEALHRFAVNVSRDSFREVGESAEGTDSHLLTRRTQLNASAKHPALDGRSTDPELFFEIHQAYPGLVELDRVSHVEVDTFIGHVYDFSTKSRWYSANGIITHNCTIAGCGHADQVWTFNATPPMLTASDPVVLSAYEAWCGYVDGDPSTDQGGVEQDVLTSWSKSTFNGRALAAFVEVDPRNLDDLRRAVFDCGVAYIGLDIPAYLENGLTAPGSVWDVDPSADNSIVGGHCVTLAGYDANGNFRAISWGSYYTLTSAFLLQRMDEAYGLVSPDWMKATGQTPAGLTVAQWQAQMAALQEQGT